MLCWCYVNSICISIWFDICTTNMLAYIMCAWIRRWNLFINLCNDWWKYFFYANFVCFVFLWKSIETYISSVQKTVRHHNDFNLSRMCRVYDDKNIQFLTIHYLLRNEQILQHICKYTIFNLCTLILRIQIQV